MKEAFNCLIMDHGIAFATGTVIFLLTVLLVAKRVIGFVLSVILILIALGASLAVDHQEIVRGYFEKWFPSTSVTAPSKAAPPSYRSAEKPLPETPSVPSQPEKSSPLKGQAETQRERVKHFMESNQRDQQSEDTEH
jgi:hypothetical protein